MMQLKMSREGFWPRVVICDLGNVILNFDRVRTYKALAEWYKIPLNQVVEMGENPELLLRYERGEMEDEPFYGEVMELFRPYESNTSGRIPFELFKNVWGNIFWSNHEMVEFLNVLKNSEEVGLVLLSNTNHMHYTYIEAHFGEVISLFGKRVVLSYREKLLKPEKEIFERALETAGPGVCVEECLYIDDRPDFIEAARLLGIQGIVYKNHHQFTQEFREK